MDKIYSPKDIEQKWYQYWEKNNTFQATGIGTPYCIMLPPPNVTGNLHMGHAFQDSIMDTLIRYHRMQGYNTLWQAGTDHAGIATQMVVERQLNSQGISKDELGREQFIQKIWEWKEQSKHTINNQLRRLGASVDWNRERFTMDDGISQAVTTVFIKLYQEGIIYRGKRLVNWDPVLLTAVSDLEVTYSEEAGFLWHINYPLTDNSGYLTIATTRPETMFADVAIAVHPKDPRYLALIGKTVTLPLTNKTIPIIADDYVDPEFGSGCVKITPAHDFNDYEIGKRHNLAIINIFTPNATINANAPAKYQGLERFIARKQVIEDLTKLNLLEKIENHLVKIPRGDRTKIILEPYLTDQWFVKVESLAKPAITAVATGQIKFVPENWTKTYFDWMNNIQDWCISRQLWWGHRIPAWYDNDGNTYVGENLETIRQQYQLPKELPLTQDADVLDTWFSAALWPFATLGWPEQTPEFKTFYPTNILITGFDIIFFWVARMIMFGLKFTGQIPFNTVYVHGLIQDNDGQKMSKSKGNTIDPLDLIDGIELEALVAKRISGLMQPQMAKQIENNTRKQFPHGIAAHGTDALRFTFCAIATTGRHLRFELTKLESYRNFCNKLWNAARYVIMNTEPYSANLLDHPKQLNLTDEWIISVWQQTKLAIQENLNKYRLDLVTQNIYEFTWNQYCDWYLEFAKLTLLQQNATAAALNGTRYTLLHILTELLMVIHPIMPFITEEIWQKVAKLLALTNKPLIIQKFPSIARQQINPKIEATVEWLKVFITGIRNIRGEMNISPNKPLTVLLISSSVTEQTKVNDHKSLLQALANLTTISWVTNREQLPPAATVVIGELTILVPLKGVVDQTLETTRLTKEIAKLNKELDRVATKLANPNYLQKAPTDVVANEQNKLQELKMTLAKLTNSLAIISKL